MSVIVLWSNFVLKTDVPIVNHKTWQVIK